MPSFFICQHCGAEFHRTRHKDRVERFCSLKCSSASRKITRICAVCGKGFHASAGPRRTNKFCSRACYGLAQRGDPAVRARAHAAVAKAVAIRQAAPPPDHGVTRYTHYDCRCDVCSAAMMAVRHNYNESTQDQAHRKGYDWTGPELELASRRDLTSIEVARMLGRTVYGVRSVRQRLNREQPREINLAGLPRH